MMSRRPTAIQPHHREALGRCCQRCQPWPGLPRALQGLQHHAYLEPTPAKCASRLRATPSTKVMEDPYHLEVLGGCAEDIIPGLEIPRALGAALTIAFVPS